MDFDPWPVAFRMLVFSRAGRQSPECRVRKIGRHVQASHLTLATWDWRLRLLDPGHGFSRFSLRDPAQALPVPKKEQS